MPIASLSPLDWGALEQSSAAWMSTAKIKQVASGVFALASLFVGTSLALTNSILGTAIAIPLYLIGSMAIWELIQGSNDEIDPSELPKIRAEAGRRPLKEIMAKYGIEAIFRHQLLPPDLFETKYRQMLSGMKSIVAIIRTYQKVAGSKPQGYQVPHPAEYASVWREEVARVSVTKVLDLFDIDLLYQYRILTTKAHKELQEVEKIWTEACKPHFPVVLRIEKAFRKTIAKELAKYKNQFNKGSKHYEDGLDQNHIAYVRTTRKVIEELYNAPREPDRSSRQRIENFLETQKGQGEPQDLFTLRMDFLKSIEKPIVIRSDGLREIDAILAPVRKSLSRKYSRTLT